MSKIELNYLCFCNGYHAHEKVVAVIFTLNILFFYQNKSIFTPNVVMCENTLIDLKQSRKKIPSNFFALKNTHYNNKDRYYTFVAVVNFII